MLKRKKILSLCCVFVLLLSMITPLAFAAQPYVSHSDTVFSVDPLETIEGAEVTFTVSVKNNHGISGFKITLTMDSSAFTFSKVSRGTISNRGSISGYADAFNAGESNSFNINYYNSNGNATNDGTLCVITLKVKDANVAGTYPVSLSYDLKNTITWDDDAAAGHGQFPQIKDIQCVGGNIVVNHDWDEGVAIPTADPEVTGTLYTCKVCGATRTEGIEHEHNWVATQTVSPTCLNAGYTVYTCSDCDETYTEAGAPALGHDFSAWRPAGDTNHMRTCSRCNEAEIAAHTFNVVTVEPTETTDGSRTSTCTVCGHVITEVIPATGHTHNYVAVVTAPTCTEAGYTTYTCAGCGDSYKVEGAPATGHRYKVTEAPPTCTEVGVKVSVCEICGDIVTEFIPATGHKYVGVETAPTCTEAGYTTYTCSVCGDQYVVAGAPALGHDFSEWTDAGDTNHKRTCSRCNEAEIAPHNFTVTETPATCTETGSKVSVCSDCGKTVTETIPATGHKYVAVVTPPTCTEAGYTTYTCSVCGDQYVVVGAPATGHSYGPWVEDGEEVHIRTCSKCDAFEAEAHRFVETVVAPTEQAGGYTLHECTVCGYSFKDNITDPLPAFKKGDINRDGNVTNADLILLANYLVNRLEFNDQQFAAADINDDGILNNTDLIYLARLIVNSI